MNQLLEQNRRKPGDVKRSLMTGTIFGKDDAVFSAALATRSEREGQELTVESLIERGLVVGTPSMWVEQISKFAEAGVERFMLQWLDLDDMDGLEAVAKEVLPHFHK